MAKRKPYLAEVSLDSRTWHLIAEYDSRREAVAAAFTASADMKRELRLHVWYRCRPSPALFGADPPELPPPPPPEAKADGQEVHTKVRASESLGRRDRRVWDFIGHLQAGKFMRIHPTQEGEADGEECWDNIVRAAEEDR